MPRLALAFLALLVVSGCTSIQQSVAESAKYQAMADRATHALGGGEVPIRVVPGTTGNSGGANCATSTITLGRDGKNVEWLLAHELGHHISGHCGSGITNEMAANESAIKVLQVWGASEGYAVRRTEQHLLSLKRGGGTLPGHDYCVEYWDIRKLYPQYPPDDPEGDAMTCPAGS